MALVVNPEKLLFTQGSIRSTFKEPHQNGRIDDAVDSLLRGNMTASDFPRLNVVAYDGRLWSLDNRRLWVFKKAQVRGITVKVSYSMYKHPRLRELIERSPGLQRRIREPGYWPKVRGPCRLEFHPPVALYQMNPKPVPVDQNAVTVMNHTPEAFVSVDFFKDPLVLGNTWPLPDKNDIVLIRNIDVPKSEFDRASTEILQQPQADTVASIFQDTPCRQDRSENHLSDHDNSREESIVVDISHDSSDAHDQYGMEDRRAAGFVPYATVSLPHDASNGTEKSKLEGYHFFGDPEAVVSILHDASYGQDRTKEDLAPGVPAAIVRNDVYLGQEDLSDRKKSSLDACVECDSAQNSGTDSTRSVSIWVMLYRKFLECVKSVHERYERSVAAARYVYQRSLGAVKCVCRKLVGGAKFVSQKLIGSAIYVYQRSVGAVKCVSQKLIGGARSVYKILRLPFDFISKGRWGGAKF